MDGFDLVIFDCDGVVVDSEVLSCQCLVDVMVRFGVPVTLDQVFERFLGRSFAAVENHYQSVRGKPLPDAFRSALRSHMLQTFSASLKQMPHVCTVLETLDRPYCLASSSDADRLRHTLIAARLEGYFGDRIFNAAMVSKGKPAPDLFLFVAEKMGARPARTLVVEDSVIGILAGKAAGMTVWGFTGGSHYAGRDVAPVLAGAGADRVFDSMAEFAGR